MPNRYTQSKELHVCIIFSSPLGTVANGVLLFGVFYRMDRSHGNTFQAAIKPVVRQQIPREMLMEERSDAG